MALVILDRDGVINHDSEDYIKSPEEWRPIAGSLEAIARLCRADYRVVIATNQSGIATGRFDIDALNQIHRKMIVSVQQNGGKIDAIFFCPHAPDDQCDCRKPKPGLLLEASERLCTPLAGVPFVGDSSSDVEAAQAVGALPILVKTGYGSASHADWLSRNDRHPFEHVPVFPDLAAFVDDLLGHKLDHQVAGLTGVQPRID